MPDREKVIKAAEICLRYIDDGDCPTECPYFDLCTQYEKRVVFQPLIRDALALLKEQEGLLGIQQTADSITFVSAGTAQQGEARGLLLGKLAMHEWLKKVLLYRGLLTDDIRAVFDDCKPSELFGNAFEGFFDE